MTRNILTIARRELQSYLRTPMGYVIAAIMLAAAGLLFNAFALRAGKRLSADVIRDFFYFSSGTTMVAGVLLSMRLFAEEFQTGTEVLLRTAPVSDAEVVLGKYLASFAFLGGVTLLTLPMPLLVMINGKISVGHLAAGYLGLLLIGSATVAIGTFGSALANNQVVAAIATAAMVVFLLLCWLLAKVTAPPISDVLSHMSLYDKHFVPFMKGVVHTRDIVYYLSVTYLFLLLATRAVRARRWA
jgi:ABC-2 type transport system permease protein